MITHKLIFDDPKRSENKLYKFIHNAFKRFEIQGSYGPCYSCIVRPTCESRCKPKQKFDILFNHWIFILIDLLFSILFIFSLFILSKVSFAMLSVLGIIFTTIILFESNDDEENILVTIFLILISPFIITFFSLGMIIGIIIKQFIKV